MLYNKFENYYKINIQDKRIKSNKFYYITYYFIKIFSLYVMIFYLIFKGLNEKFYLILMNINFFNLFGIYMN